MNLSEYGLEPDGLPPLGKNLKQGDPEMCVYDKVL